LEHAVTIGFGATGEPISQSRLRKFVDDLRYQTPPPSIHDPGEPGVHLLAEAAAIAPALAAEVLEFRSVVTRALSEGCPRAGKHCAWCGTDLTQAVERHHRVCPWLAILNASSGPEGSQPPPKPA